MHSFTDGQYAAYIGIDWADAKHDICLHPADSAPREFTCIPHQVDEIEQWALSLRQRFGGPARVGCTWPWFNVRWRANWFTTPTVRM
jgi:hypothetical protein